MIITTFLKIFFKTTYFTVYLTHWIFSRFKYVVFYSIFDTRTGATRHKTIGNNVNYDIFDKKAIANHDNYDILKIGALGYHDNYDVFEKYFLKTMYFTVYLTHWIFSRFKYVVFYNIFDTRTDCTRHFRR